MYSSDTKSRAESQGVSLHVVEVEKGLMDENIHEILRITPVDTGYAYAVVNYVDTGNIVSLLKLTQHRPLNLEMKTRQPDAMRQAVFVFTDIPQAR